VDDGDPQSARSRAAPPGLALTAPSPGLTHWANRLRPSRGCVFGRTDFTKAVLTDTLEPRGGTGFCHGECGPGLFRSFRPFGAFLEGS
jgi:hypothetical protein